MDFGGLKPFKAWLDDTFDHTLVMAEDDPELERFQALNLVGGGYKDQGLVDLRVVPAVGCEGFAKLAYDKMAELLEELKVSHPDRYPVGQSVQLVSAEVFEHESNSAIYQGI
jgi:6-pyruvoyltetrahydropterin/6-carboxytetrahydropterin synthase